MRVLVIHEDQHRDQYILEPIIERLFKETAQVEVLPEPRMRGTGDALDRTVISEIVMDNEAMTDLFLLVVDRDCDRESNTVKVANIETDHPNVLLGCLAFQEVEVWMLAVHELAEFGASSWKDVREECDPKERFAQPFLVHGFELSPESARRPSRACRLVASNEIDAVRFGRRVQCRVHPHDGLLNGARVRRGLHSALRSGIAVRGRNAARYSMSRRPPLRGFASGTRSTISSNRCLIPPCRCSDVRTARITFSAACSHR